MEETSKPLTAFITYNGLYEFNVLPMGLVNSPSLFQRTQDVILAGLQWEICLVYLDDIVVFSKDFSTHLKNLKEIFERFREANIKFTPNKCFFACKEVEFLGHVISEDGIRPDVRKTDIVKSYPAPRNPKELKAFLGITGYYRRFIKDYAKLASPLYKLLKKNANFLWCEKCEEAFEKLKECLITRPILAYPNFELPFTLYVVILR